MIDRLVDDAWTLPHSPLGMLDVIIRMAGQDPQRVESCWAHRTAQLGGVILAAPEISSVSPGPVNFSHYRTSFIVATDADLSHYGYGSFEALLAPFAEHQGLALEVYQVSVSPRGEWHPTFSQIGFISWNS